MPGTRVPSVVTVHASTCDSRKSAVLLKKLRSGFIRSLPAKISRANQGRDVGSQSGRGITAGFLPAFLLGHRPMPKQVTCGFQHHRVGVKILKGILLAEAQGQQYREGDLIQLDSRQYGFPLTQKFCEKPPSSC
jgi:hypothetical protein